MEQNINNHSEANVVSMKKYQEMRKNTKPEWLKPMIAISPKANAVMQKLWNAALASENGYIKLDSKTGFMPVVVEIVQITPNVGNIICIAHYGKQNGDLMADPRMDFFMADGDYYPATFQNDYMGIYQKAIEFNSHGKPIRYIPKLQRELVEFCDLWMSNIITQQEI